MRLNKLVLTFALSLLSCAVFAQNVKVTGKVVDEQGEPVISAVVMVDGVSNIAATTGVDGSYSIEAPAEGALVYSFLGYETVTEKVGGRGVINVTMKENQNFLDEVVVSALGIKRESKVLTYSAQQVNASELSANKSLNMINSLAGKAAGVLVSSSASGLGGTSKISIRGFRSIAGDNEPLYIINGVPLSNDSSSSSDFYGSSGSASYDRGDGISNLNSDDIESITVLKGASASALYGTQAANGVIIITTKSGSAGKIKVTLSNSTSFDTAAYGPQLQRTYAGSNDDFKSWGAKLSKPATLAVDNFFRTGVTMVNNISLQGGNSRSQNYLSYSNTHATGLLENSGMDRHNVTFRNTTKLVDNLSLDASIQLVHQNVKNRPSPGGSYINPLIGVYKYPVGLDFSTWKENFEIYDPERNMMVQNWNKVVDAHSDQNPYWILYRDNSEQVRDRLIASATLKWDVTPHFNLQARASEDYSADTRSLKYAATTSPAIINSINGLYKAGYSHGGTTYFDVLASYKNSWDWFDLNATVGGSYQMARDAGVSYDSRKAGMQYANIFAFNNMIDPNGDESLYQKDLAAVFATATLGFKDCVFVDLTARNDWSSTLAYTKSFKSGFFYPSVGVTVLFNEIFDMPKCFDLAKIRGSYSVVGNDLPSRVTNPLSSVNYDGTISANTTAPFGDLKPELSSSFEVGADIRMFKGRFNLDFTWYRTNTTNQIFELPAPSGSGYSTYYVNSGNIMNTGIELTIGGYPVDTPNFKWNTSLNLSHNRNLIVALHPTLPEFVISNSGSYGYNLKLKEGGSYGDMYARGFARDDAGKLILDDKGLPTLGDTFTPVGNVSPVANIGWNNSFEICKNFNVSFLIDARIGGKVMSLTQSELDPMGVTQATADARERGYVEYEGIKFNDVKAFYDRVGTPDVGMTEYYVYDGTNIRLREASIGFNAPEKWFQNLKVLHGASLSLVGRNLFFLYKKAPYDPDALMGLGNDLNGVEFFGMPSARTFGFNVKLTF